MTSSRHSPRLVSVSGLPLLLPPPPSGFLLPPLAPVPASGLVVSAGLLALAALHHPDLVRPEATVSTQQADLLPAHHVLHACPVAQLVA